jgi:hypothetical protein
MYTPNTKILGTLNNNKIKKNLFVKKLSMVKKHSEKAEKYLEESLNNINRSKSCVRIFNAVPYTHSQHVSKFASSTFVSFREDAYLKRFLAFFVFEFCTR